MNANDNTRIENVLVPLESLTKSDWAWDAHATYGDRLAYATRLVNEAAGWRRITSDDAARHRARIDAIRATQRASWARV